MHIHTATMKRHLTRTEYNTMEDFLFNVKTNDYGTVYPKNNSVLFHHHQGGFHLKLYRGKDANGYYHQVENVISQLRKKIDWKQVASGEIVVVKGFGYKYSI